LPPYRRWPARPGPGFSGKAGGKAPEGCGPLDSGDSWSTRRSSLDTRHVMACRDRLQLFLCLVVEHWILWGQGLFADLWQLLLCLQGCSNLSAPLAKGGWHGEAVTGGWERSESLFRYDSTPCHVPTLPSFASQMPPPLNKGRQEALPCWQGCTIAAMPHQPLGPPCQGGLARRSRDWGVETLRTALSLRNKKQYVMSPVVTISLSAT